MKPSTIVLLLKNFIGGCEETSTGSIRLKAMKEKNELKVPVIDLNNAYSKYLFDNVKEPIISNMKG